MQIVRAPKPTQITMTANPCPILAPGRQVFYATSRARPGPGAIRTVHTLVNTSQGPVHTLVNTSQGPVLTPGIPITVCSSDTNIKVNTVLKSEKQPPLQGS